MSVISNRHSILPFESGKSAALDGQRLAKVTYKPRGKNPARFPSVCVSVPMIPFPTSDQLERLMPHVLAMLETAQDGIVRSLYESSDGAMREVSDEDIGFNAIMGFLEAEASGGHLSKEKIGQWFTQNLRDNLTVTVAEKLGFDLSTPEQEQTVARHVRGYDDLFQSLAGKSVMMETKQIHGLQRALEISSGDDEIGQKLGKKLADMLIRPKIEDLLEL